MSVNHKAYFAISSINTNLWCLNELFIGLKACSHLKSDWLAPLGGGGADGSSKKFWDGWLDKTAKKLTILLMLTCGHREVYVCELLTF